MSNAGGTFATSSEDQDVHIQTINSIQKDVKDDSEEQSLQAEKGDIVTVTQRRDSVLSSALLSHEEQFPIDEDGEVETQQFTFRAVFTGCILGGIIAASNVYLGLKTGWTFGASLFGSIFGFAILKPLSKALPTYLGGGYFGPKENVCVQSTATAAGSLGLLFTSGFPAAYQLGLLSRTPKEDFGKLITFTACCAYYGMFFAIPLRKFYILKLKLTYPAAVAAAHTIRSLHVGKNAAANARKKTKALIISFCLAITWRCTSEYAPGIMWDWHWGWTFYRLGWTNMIYVENWNFIWEWTPAFIGAGMLTGINASYSFFGGAILAWGVIAPSLITTGKAFGEAVSSKYPGYMNYMGMVLEDPVDQPSPRYWLLWPGVMFLLAGSFAELGANYKTLWASFKLATKPIIGRFRKVEINENDLIHDPCHPHELVPWWMWTGGLLISGFFTCLVLGLQYDMNVGISILSIIFAAILSIIGAESSGRTNITPVLEASITCIHLHCFTR